MTGIVMAGGDQAVTSAAAVGKASHVEIVTSTGQYRRVRVLGRDPHSGIAVVSTGGGLTPAPFASGNVEPGELAVAACLCGSAAVATAADEPSATVAVGEVRKVGTPAVLSGGTDLVDTIEADMPLGPAPLGGVLLNAQGQVVGILDARQGTGAGRTGVFVPALAGRRCGPGTGQLPRRGSRMAGNHLHRRPRWRRGPDHRRHGRESGRLGRAASRATSWRRWTPMRWTPWPTSRPASTRARREHRSA